VESGISNKCATIKVDYNENGGICKVNICLNDFVSDKVNISKKCYQWRLLELKVIMGLGESGHHRQRVVISLRDPLPLMAKNCKPSVIFSNKLLFYMKRSAIFLYKFVQ
jgi:hypothetical protein